MTAAVKGISASEAPASRDMSAMQKLESLVPKLAGRSVRMKDEKSVLSKIETMIAGQLSRLQVIADFDYTLTRFHYHGKRCLTCYGVVEDSEYFTQDFRDKLLDLKDKYYPIEISHELSVEEKIPLMKEWYSKGNALLIENGLSLDIIRTIVKGTNVKLRCRAQEMFKILEENAVPLLIFSAGLGDVIDEILREQGGKARNMHVIANRFQFDENGKAVGLKGDLIHMFNKNETAVCHASYFEDLTHRPNVLLMGDSTGDSHMAEGVANPNVVLKIGFLNTKVEERLPLFLEAFDIVLLDDQTMDVPIEIIHVVSRGV